MHPILYSGLFLRSLADFTGFQPGEELAASFHVALFLTEVQKTFVADVAELFGCRQWSLHCSR